MIKWSNYWKPTTKTMRAVGDTLLGNGYDTNWKKQYLQGVSIK